MALLLSAVLGLVQYGGPDGWPATTFPTGDCPFLAGPHAAICSVAAAEKACDAGGWPGEGFDAQPTPVWPGETHVWVSYWRRKDGKQEYITARVPILWKRPGK